MISSDAQRVGLCGTNHQETLVLILTLAPSGCVSLGNSPDLSGHYFPHFIHFLKIFIYLGVLGLSYDMQNL